MIDKVTDSEADTPIAPVTFGPEIDLFCKHIDAIGDVLILMVMAVQEITTQSKEKLTNFEKQNCEVTDGEDERTVKIPNEHYRDWKRHVKRFEHFTNL